MREVDRARRIADCPYRTDVRLLGGLEAATCGLLQRISGVCDPQLLTAAQDVCEACCREREPSESRLNPVVASLLYGLSRHVIEAGGVDGCDAAKARELKRWAWENLAVVEPGPADNGTRVSYAGPCFYLGDQTGEKECPACRGSVRLKVFACRHELHDETTIRRCTRCPDYEPRLTEGVVRQWAVGITTALRPEPMLGRTVASLRRAGWPTPHLFVEPGTDLPPEVNGLPVSQRKHTLGAWPNWLLGLMELTLLKPDADAYLMCQDDVVFCRNLRQYLEQTLWPAPRLGVVSLFSPGHGPAPAPAAQGFYEDVDGWSAAGAHACIFPNASARALLRHPAVVNHRQRGRPDGARHVDGVIERWRRSTGLAYYTHAPSLAQHIGRTSTLEPGAALTGKRRAATFPGERADARRLPKPRQSSAPADEPASSDDTARSIAPPLVTADAPPRSIHPNDYFDRIYCINLDRRPDRWRFMRWQFERFGLSVQRVPAVDGLSPRVAAEYRSLLGGAITLDHSRRRYWISSEGAYGCLLSHIRVLEDAADRGCRRILIFEDDACLHLDFLGEFQKLSQLPDDWKLLFLGGLQFVEWERLRHHDPCFYHAHRTMGAFALGVDRSVFGEVLDLYRQRDAPNDRALLSLQSKYAGRCFVCLPNLAIMDVRRSDNRAPDDQRRYAERVRWDLAQYHRPPAERPGCVPIGAAAELQPQASHAAVRAEEGGG